MRTAGLQFEFQLKELATSSVFFAIIYAIILFDLRAHGHKMCTDQYQIPKIPQKRTKNTFPFENVQYEASVLLCSQ